MSHYDTQAEAEKLDAQRAAADLANSRADVPREYQRNEEIKKENMKEITLDWLKSQSSCQDGYEWSIKTLDKKSMLIKDFIGTLMAENRFNWANWVIVRCMDKPQKVTYAIFAAEQVIDIFIKRYPGDKRPRTAIDAAKTWLKNPCDETKAAASASAANASASAYASDAAANAAANASAYAADAAAYSANASAAYSADAAAYSADAYAAANAAYAADAAANDIRKQIRIKIINYGLSLLGTGEK